MAEIALSSTTREEDRILRRWTPLLLRSILLTAMAVLSTGLVLDATYSPDYFVHRYREVQLGHLIGHESFANMCSGIVNHNPHAVTMVGLFVLTLVPLVRVAFCFALFIREGDRKFVVLTGYVLLGLVLGIVLGRVG